MVGSNISAIWFHRGLNDIWDKWSWSGSDEYGAVSYIKQQYNLPDDTDNIWPLTFPNGGISSVAPIAPVAMGAACPAGDPNNGVILGSNDPNATATGMQSQGSCVSNLSLLSLNQDSGCVDKYLTAMAHGVEDQVINGANGEQTAHDELNNNGNACAICIPWTWTVGKITMSGCTYGAWTRTFGPKWSPVSCTETCGYSASGNCTCTRTRVHRKLNCTMCLWVQTGTFTGKFIANNVDFFPTCVQPSGYVCPPVPNGTPIPTKGRCTGWTPSSPPCGC